ncbi:MAG: hypothetical protein ACD_78C00042G0005 [uncultured bacterium (gcode 4)]|uniref:Uncharacterized protein n=1 Tax=uncultured bacterium (gcode 4) TaxID=1234023 RepID=K1YE00_9BACT|nr:MAG: hypothetical protein ACD_78C00042G0005 [uncultured bacterium (gcode 4)]
MVKFIFWFFGEICIIQLLFRLTSTYMSTITVNIPNKVEHYILPKELEATISELILEYIETKQDMELKQELTSDQNFAILNRNLDMKLWSL